MKIALALICTLLLGTSSNSAHAQAQVTPIVEMNCINPNLAVSFTSVQHTQASTEPVQFNINIPAGRGTIFVNENNSGICTATISDGFQFTGGSGNIDPTQVSVSGPYKAADLMSSLHIVPRIQGNQMMIFEVSSDRKEVKGNLTIRFITRYKSD